LTPTVKTIVIMGISGCGKSTLGKGLAEAIGYRFIEGDDLHPPDNIAKMSAGVALTDDDRWPWLARIAETLAAARNGEGNGEGCVVACSALRQVYRDLLRARADERLLFVFPDVSMQTAEDRLRRRPGHYMPPSLIESQMATLEWPGPNEPVLCIDGAAPPEQSIAQVMAYLSAVAGMSDRRLY